MTVLDTEPRFAECFDVPSFSATHFTTEQAGGGCVNLYGYLLKRGVLVPQYHVLAPAKAMLTGSQLASAAALVAMKDGWAGIAH